MQGMKYTLYEVVSKTTSRFVVNSSISQIQFPNFHCIYYIEDETRFG